MARVTDIIPTPTDPAAEPAAADTDQPTQPAAEATPNHRSTAEVTSVADELAAMRRIVAALDGLDASAQARTMRWLADRYTTPSDW